MMSSQHHGVQEAVGGPSLLGEVKSSGQKPTAVVDLKSRSAKMQATDARRATGNEQAPKGALVSHEHHFATHGSTHRHVVKHEYHDHSSVTEEEHMHRIFRSSSLSSVNGGNIEPKPQRARGGVTIPFPTKLHGMLEKIATQEEEKCLATVVSWQPHGRAFLVRKPKEFVDKVMPRFFRQTKITSFQRQLNLYGFRRITKGSDNGAYYHELFLRGKPFLASRMIRTKIKGTGFKAASSPETEPDFYKMPPVTPIRVDPELVNKAVNKVKAEMNKQECASELKAQKKGCSDDRSVQRIESSECSSPSSMALHQPTFPFVPVSPECTPVCCTLREMSVISPVSSFDSLSGGNPVPVSPGDSMPDKTPGDELRKRDVQDFMTFEGQKFHYLESTEVTDRTSHHPESMLHIRCNKIALRQVGGAGVAIPAPLFTPILNDQDSETWSSDEVASDIDNHAPSLEELWDLEPIIPPPSCVSWEF